MGTRHLVAVYVDGEYKVAQYGQFDGYPEGAGATVLSALSTMSPDDLEDFREKVRATVFLSPQEITRRWEHAGARNGMADQNASQTMARDNPQLLRDMSADVLEFIAQNAPGVELSNNISFAGDSLFCEYAYVVDLDANTLEVYQGFNKEPLDPAERFASFAKSDPEDNLNLDDVYHPVRLWRTFDLNHLPSEEEFVKALSEDEEEAPSPSLLKI